MAGKAVHLIGKAVGERVLGFGPSPVRAAAAATVLGTATALLSYRLLRAGGSDEK